MAFSDKYIYLGDEIDYSNAISNRLIASYPLNELGGTYAFNRAKRPTVITGAINNQCTWKAMGGELALNFPKNNTAFINCGTGGNMSGDRTISVWFYLPSGFTGSGTLISKRNAITFVANYQVSVSTAGCGLSINGTNPNFSGSNTNVAPTTNVWHNFVGVVRNGVIYPYFNGFLPSGATTGILYAGNDSVPTALLRIGQNHDNNSPMDGGIKNINIWNRALSDTEIRYIYANPYCMYKSKKPNIIYQEIIANLKSKFWFFFD